MDAADQGYHESLRVGRERKQLREAVQALLRAGGLDHSDQQVRAAIAATEGQGAQAAVDWLRNPPRQPAARPRTRLGGVGRGIVPVFGKAGEEFLHCAFDW